MIGTVVSLALTVSFIAILLLCRHVLKVEQEIEEAEIREMLRQDKRRENFEWYISTRADDARADLFRVWVSLEVR